MMEYKALNKQFWGQHLWERGYFVASSGNVTDEVIVASPNLPALASSGSVHCFW